jgi:cytochrome P450
MPTGTKAIACLRETMHDPATFPAPETFDPDRFSPQRAEDKQPADRRRPGRPDVKLS